MHSVIIQVQITFSLNFLQPPKSVQRRLSAFLTLSVPNNQSRTFTRFFALHSGLRIRCFVIEMSLYLHMQKHCLTPTSTCTVFIIRRLVFFANEIIHGYPPFSRECVRSLLLTIPSILLTANPAKRNCTQNPSPCLCHLRQNVTSGPLCGQFLLGSNKQA